MTLEETLKGEVLQYGGSAGALKSVLTRVRDGQGPSDRGTLRNQELNLILNYITETDDSDMTPAEAEAILRDRRVTDEQKTQAFMPYLPQAYEHFKGNLIDRVSQDDNHREMISTIEGESLLGVALATPISEDLEGNEEYADVIKSKQEYDKWSEKHEEGNTDEYLNSLHPAFKAILESTNAEGERLFSNDEIGEYLGIRAQYHQSEFFNGIGVDVERFNQGKRTRNQEMADSSVNTESVRNYIGVISEGLEEDQKTELYEETGIAYAGHLAQENLNRQNAEYQALAA
tara:strand:- start:1342 stop:2205 length:864 start_codon:yes stop_codon:yes gene_type:complete